MKKAMSVLAMLILLFSLGLAGNSFHVSVTGNYFKPSDDGYRTIYGQGMIVPEIEAGINLYRGLFLWLSYGYLQAEGTLPVIEDVANSNQHHFSAGAGYRLHISGFMEFGIQLGSFNVYYLEETPGDRESGLAFGFRGDIHYVFYIGSRFFLGLSGGYLRAAKSVHSSTVYFGGFRGGFKIGLRF